MLFPVFGCWLLLLASKSLAVPRPNVLEAILGTVRNIEDLIRGSPESSIYTSPAGQSSVAAAAAAAAASFHPPHLPQSRDTIFDVDPFEKDELREILNWDSLGSRSANTNSNSNTNSNGNVNRKQKLPTDEMPSGYYRRSLPKIHRLSRIQDRPMGEEDEANAIGNVNSNSNANVNTNTNVNTNAIEPTPGNNPISGMKMKSARNPSGSRSLLKPRMKNVNRNVNKNVNSNTNTNSINNGNGLNAFNDDEFDYEN